jgi:hypothetical protein
MSADTRTKTDKGEKWRRRRKEGSLSARLKL